MIDNRGPAVSARCTRESKGFRISLAQKSGFAKKKNCFEKVVHTSGGKINRKTSERLQRPIALVLKIALNFFPKPLNFDSYG